MNAMIKEKHIVESVQGDIRINDYLIDIFHSLPSKKSIKKALMKTEMTQCAMPFGVLIAADKNMNKKEWINRNLIKFIICMEKKIW